MKHASNAIDGYVEDDPTGTETVTGMISTDSKLKFPCPENGDYVTIADCWDCARSARCDIYASMLDEDM